MSEFRHETRAIRAASGENRVVDAFTHPDVPGLALTKLDEGVWTITHVTTGCRVSLYRANRALLEGLFFRIGALRDWSAPLPAYGSTEFRALENTIADLNFPISRRGNI